MPTGPLDSRSGAEPGDSPRPKRSVERFRLIPRLETHPAVLSFAQTLPGRLALLGVFSALQWLTNAAWAALVLWLTLTTLMPARRRVLVTGAAISFAVMRGLLIGPSQLLDTAFVLTLAGLMFWVVARFRGSWYGRRPIAALLGSFAILVLLTSAAAPQLGKVYIPLWSLLKEWGVYLWFIGYSLLDRRLAKSPDNFLLQLGTYRPFWGSTHTPFVKGAAYLRRIEAHTPLELAIVQIKGVKLFAWSLFLAVVLKVFVGVVHGYLRIPEYDRLFASSVQRVPFPWCVAWASLIAEFLENLLRLSIWGHRFVASCRMAGFGALRNTYRPLEARTVADFWNRYYFYFKELLVDFFFYPTFMRYFKGWPRLRLIAATLVAAGVGNAYYHFFRDMDYIETLGFWRALTGFHVYVFYCVVLSTGITVSQFRARRFDDAGWIRGRLVPAVCVGGFFCLLRVFDYTGRDYPITEHFRFVAHLFNLVS